METLILMTVLGTSVWMAFDAHHIGYDKKDVKGMAGMGPLGWLFGGLLLWIIVFPFYLASRSKLKTAASPGASTPTDGIGPIPGTPSVEGTERDGASRQGGVSPLRKKLGTAVGVFFGGWLVLALGWNAISASSVPACDAPEVVSLANQVIQESPLMQLLDIQVGEIQSPVEKRYDNDERLCQAIVKSAMGAEKVSYTVEWHDAKKGTFWVEFAE